MSLTPEEERLVQKRVPDNVCARCRRPILLGHRIQHAFVCYDPNALNPERVTERGLSLGTDCEFVHVECMDPYLDGKYATMIRT
jgi:hypothetical protein